MSEAIVAVKKTKLATVCLIAQVLRLQICSRLYIAKESDRKSIESA